jgi:hypothetical protein
MGSLVKRKEFYFLTDRIPEQGADRESPAQIAEENSVQLQGTASTKGLGNSHGQPSGSGDWMETGVPRVGCSTLSSAANSAICF